MPFWAFIYLMSEKINQCEVYIIKKGHINFDIHL